jgi:hypothetical protein
MALDFVANSILVKLHCLSSFELTTAHVPIQSKLISVSVRQADELAD